MISSTPTSTSVVTRSCRLLQRSLVGRTSHPSVPSNARGAKESFSSLSRSFEFSKAHVNCKCLFCKKVSPASMTSGIDVGVGISSPNNSFSGLRFFSDAKGTNDEENKEATKDQGPEEAETKGEETTESDAASEEAAPSREEQLEAQVADLKDQVLRGLAEQENVRRIAKRDVDEARQFAIKSFAKSLLDVSDNLSRALESVPEDIRHDKEGNAVLATLYEGIEMTDKGLTKAFEMNGLVKFGEVGEKFDPNTHEALFEYVDAEKDPGTVGQVMKSGFLLNKRVLRPAEVGVTKKE